MIDWLRKRLGVLPAGHYAVSGELYDDLKNAAVACYVWERRARKSWRQAAALRKMHGWLRRDNERLQKGGYAGLRFAHQQTIKMGHRLEEHHVVREKLRGEYHAEAVEVFRKLLHPTTVGDFACALGNLRKGKNAS